MSYREVIEGARDRGAAYAESIARDAYEQHVGADPPADLDELIAALPSMVETVTALVRAMADAGTEALVVDLRDNPGGDSRFLQQLGYVLFGVDAIVEATDWAIAIKRRTSAWGRSARNSTPGNTSGTTRPTGSSSSRAKRR